MNEIIHHHSATLEGYEIHIYMNIFKFEKVFYSSYIPYSCAKKTTTFPMNKVHFLSVLPSGPARLRNVQGMNVTLFVLKGQRDQM